MYLGQGHYVFRSRSFSSAQMSPSPCPDIFDLGIVDISTYFLPCCEAPFICCCCCCNLIYVFILSLSAPLNLSFLEFFDGLISFLYISVVNDKLPLKKRRLR